jgi:hypothetical protein
MSQESRKQIGQVVLLLILLGVLGFCMWYFLFKPQPASQSAGKAARPASAAQPAAQATTDQAGTAPAAGKPAYGTAGAEQAAATAAGKEPKLTKAEAPFSLEMNPNQFEVFTLSPPKNPFVQQERWYAEQLKTMPGYPDLRDDGYFDSMEPYLPDLEKYFGSSDDWQQVQLTRQQAPPDFQITGTSKKGDITTNVNVTRTAEPPVDITWTPESGIPLSALRTPGWEKQLPAAANLEHPGAAPEAGAPGGGALSVPGSGGQAAGGGGTEAQPAGDTISVSGVNLKESTASAVMVYNGTPYLVSIGSVLPTHYQVLAIKADGVVLLELRDGSSQWIPLSVAGPPAKQKR